MQTQVFDALTGEGFRPSMALTARRLSKSYGATVALGHADIDLAGGEVQALLGENGAGKSTLVKILTGAVRADEGRMQLSGVEYRPRSLLDARDSGVATAFQELSLVPNLTVAQNLLLPGLPRSWSGLVSGRVVLEKARDILDRNGLQRIDPTFLISDLPLAERQRIEIVRAIERSTTLLILDEPTAALAETDWLFDRIHLATSRGVAVLYISHRLAEVREICSAATVLRNGRSIASVSLSQASDDDIFEMMVGRKADHGRKRHGGSLQRHALPRLEARDLCGPALHDVRFELRPGEVLGVAALEGQGQRSLFRLLSGLDRPTEGEIRIDGAAVRLNGPRSALKTGSGIAFLPEERKTEGILSSLSAATNVVLPVLPQVSHGGLISPAGEFVAAVSHGERVEMAERYLAFPIGDLSGGNQQKALVARTIASGARTLLLFDPTRGVDVGTKQSIYAAIRAFAAEGGSVLFYSSELPEVVQLADRCLVLYGGRLSREFEGDTLTEQRLVAAILDHEVPMAAEGRAQ
jgi:ribose transport system ATP-binding protein